MGAPDSPLSKSRGGRGNRVFRSADAARADMRRFREWTADRHTVNRRRSVPWLAGVLFLVGGFCGERAASAHALFMSYVQHRTAITVGPANIDITIELTFFETRSISERRRMDADADGTITVGEIQSYLARIADSLDGGIGLRIAGRPVAVMPLYQPEVDLLGVDQVAPCHHVLRLFYFARTPDWLAPGSQIVIDDGLWQHTARIGSLEITGQGGFRIAGPTGAESRSDADGTGRPLVMSASCLAVPAAAKRVEKRAADREEGVAKAAASLKTGRRAPSLRTDWRVASLGIVFVLACSLAGYHRFGLRGRR